jgi:hypothetical protein
MTRRRSILTVTVLALAGAGLAAAAGPAALSGASPGLWEIDGIPGARAPARECVADVAALSQFEHRRAICSRTVVTDAGNSTVIQYQCPGGGFGRSKLTMITPRSIRVETQGISDSLPFNYVLQARRVGDCPGRSSASAH